VHRLANNGDVTIICETVHKAFYPFHPKNNLAFTPEIEPMDTDDAKEGLAVFREKRFPQVNGHSVMIPKTTELKTIQMHLGPQEFVVDQVAIGLAILCP
jgi:hypothetical protein